MKMMIIMMKITEQFTSGRGTGDRVEEQKKKTKRELGSSAKEC